MRIALTSVVDVVDDVEVVLHRGAVSAAEAGGEEEEQHQRSGQPAACKGAKAHISHSPLQHAVQDVKALGGMEHTALLLNCLWILNTETIKWNNTSYESINEMKDYLAHYGKDISLKWQNMKSALTKRKVQTEYRKLI